MPPKHCAIVYAAARANDTFLATSSPKVTARDSGCAVNEDEDHAAEGPRNAKKADNIALGGMLLVTDDRGKCDREEEKRGNYHSSVERPAFELFHVQERNE
ncbi:hypothetical protein ACFX13_018577 [Malus domestica]